jgi:hypothetical protein
VVEYKSASLKKALSAAKKVAALEGLGAHGKSAEVRLSIRSQDRRRACR